MTSRGRFIVIEGLDRSGKSTQAERLYTRLETQLGVGRVKLLKFPNRTTAIGKMIDSYLRSQAELDDRLIHLLFAANRWEAASTILSDLKAGVTIVCDRYAFSGIAFSLAKGLPFEWCLFPDIGLPAPDLVLFFDISPEVARERGGYGEERYEREEMQRNVRVAFERIAQAQKEGDGKWVEIDAGRKVDAVGNDVWRQLGDLHASDIWDVGKLWVDRLEQSG